MTLHELTPITLGPLGRELVLRLLGDAGAGGSAHALAGVLVDAYAALGDGDLAAARAVLAEVLAPAAALEQAITHLQRAQVASQDATAALAQATPAAISAELAFTPAALTTWREALEASIVAAEELLARITALQQVALAAQEG